MKNTIFIAVTAALISMSACNRIDTELVGRVQATVNKTQEGKTKLEGINTNIANLAEQMAKAPDGLKLTAAYGYPDLNNKVKAFEQKFSAMSALQTDLSGKLETLLGDYTDGKIKKEEMVKEYEAVVTELDGIQQSVDRISPMFDQISAEYAKMMATWQALPEAERAAAVANQPSEAALETATLPKGNN